MAKPYHKNDRKPEEKEFFEEVLQIDRVTRVVSGGRRLRFRATVVIGNKKGKVGMGVGKANEVVTAIQKATRKAKKSFVELDISNGTIPFPHKTKFKSAKLLLMPAGEGTGIIAGGASRKVIELVGIKNILSKSLGSSNKINLARATIQALENFTTAAKFLTDRTKKAEKAE